MTSTHANAVIVKTLVFASTHVAGGWWSQKTGTVHPGKGQGGL